VEGRNLIDKALECLKIDGLHGDALGEVVRRRAGRGVRWRSKC
jgi:hypothetical protein